MTLRKDVENVVNLREFHRSVEQLLTPEDRDYLFYSLKEYNTYRSVAKLMLALNSCLDTPEKLDLLPYVRELIPKHDRRKFDSLAPYDRMAHETSPPPAVKARVQESTTTTPSRGSAAPSPSQEATRVITIQRPRGTSLGFSIRGGREHELGVYVSHVDSLSLAEKYGLQPGDQILNVNGVSFEQITHSSAALVLTSHDEFRMVVKSVGRIPGRQTGRNSFIWVDAKGNPIGDVDAVPDTTKMVTENRAAGHRLLASPDRHKVVLHASRKKPMGFSIRGGSEYNLGIYISVVDKDSLAKESGLRVGDQVLDVNGHSFVNIIHAEAVTILRSYPTLIMTIKSLGRLPRLATEMQAWHEDGPKESPQPADQGLQSRTSSFFKALASPLSPRRKSPPKRDTSHYTSDAVLYKGQSALGFTKRGSQNRGEKAPRYASEGALYRTPETAVPLQPPRTSQGSDVRRVRSFHEPTPEGAASDKSQMRPQPLSTGANTLPRARGTKSPIGLSPLVTSDVRAPTSPTQTSPPPSSPNRVEVGSRSTRRSPRDPGGLKHRPARSPEHARAGIAKSQGPEFHQVHSPTRSPIGTGAPPRVPSSPGGTSGMREGTRAEAEEPRFFEYGVGTQVMLSSASSQAMGILLSRARKLLDAAAVGELRERIKQYEQTQQIESLVQFLVTVLDSPDKLQLLTDIRSILQPSDLPKFDELVSKREVDALHERTSQGRHWGQYDFEEMEKADQEYNDEVADRYTMVLTEIQNGGGQRALRHSREEDAHPPRHQTRDLGAFGNSTAQEMLDKASSDEPSMIGLQTKESFLAWNDEYSEHRRDAEKSGFTPSHSSSSNAVVVEIVKSAPNLGLTIEGGVDTPKSEVRIVQVHEGAAHNDGFLKAGFEIVEVDGIKVRGNTHEKAARTIKQAFSSENPTIEFVVVPN